jgi:anti-sigma regulatory factor (Ser/Thr protein kinase)
VALKIDDPEVLCLEVPPEANFEGIRHVLDQLEPFLRGEAQQGAQPVIVDMRAVRSCSATGITILAAALEHLFVTSRFTNKSEMWLPKSPLVMQHLHRMDFFDELRMDVPRDSAEMESQGFRPVTHVSGEAESPAVARNLVSAVEESYEIDSSVSGALKSCVNEVIENVFYHARSPIDALVSVQAFDGKAELVIADTGRGIRAALSEEPKYQGRVGDDCSAIRLALEKNVTTTGDDRRGIGLWVVSELVRKNEGRMLVLSNGGGIDIGCDGTVEVDRYFWPGTIVAVEFDMEKAIDMQEVYAGGEFDDDYFDF